MDIVIPVTTEVTPVHVQRAGIGWRSDSGFDWDGVNPFSLALEEDLARPEGTVLVSTKSVYFFEDREVLADPIVIPAPYTVKRLYEGVPFHLHLELPSSLVPRDVIIRSLQEG